MFVKWSYINNNIYFVNNQRSRTFVIYPLFVSSSTITIIVAVSLQKCVQKGIGSFVVVYVVVNYIAKIEIIILDISSEFFPEDGGMTTARTTIPSLQFQVLIQKKS